LITQYSICVCCEFEVSDAVVVLMVDNTNLRVRDFIRDMPLFGAAEHNLELLAIFHLEQDVISHLVLYFNILFIFPFH